MVNNKSNLVFKMQNKCLFTKTINNEKKNSCKSCQMKIKTNLQKVCYKFLCFAVEKKL